MLAGRLRDLGDQFNHFLAAGADRLKHLAGCPHLLVALFDLRDGPLNHRGGIPGRFRRPDGQISHFIGDNGEPRPRFAGTGGLHRRIEGQQVGLKGDLVDGLDDLRCFFTGV